MPAGRTRRRTGSALAPAGFARRPFVAVALAALLVVASVAAAHAQEAKPTGSSHTRAYVAMGTGLALTGLSFVFAEQADRNYDDYLTETDPDAIEDAYQATLRSDRIAAGTLIAGQAALVLGIYWRFLHHPDDESANEAPRWGVRPRIDADGAAGLALDVRF